MSALDAPIQITDKYTQGPLARAVPEALPQRLRDKIAVDERDCWLWTGCKHPDGYGKTVLDGRYRYAHCAVYELLVGAVPAPLQLDHLCRTRACVNPAHLEAVTSAVNRARGIHRNQHQDKTHCPRGHEYTAANTYSYGGRSGRHCKACGRLKKAGLL